MMLKTVSGQFKNFFGTIDFDGNNLDAATVNAEIQVGSIDTSNAGRDKHLRTKDFFDASSFPTMTYKSNKIVVDSKGAFKIYGTLSMHGLSRNVTLDAEPLHSASRSDDGGNERLGTTAVATLDRKDFGISSGPLDRGGTVVSDQVKIIMDIELTPVQNISHRNSTL
jgi:polyisoprenoid-binding protein YceI